MSTTGTETAAWTSTRFLCIVLVQMARTSAPPAASRRAESARMRPVASQSPSCWSATIRLKSRESMRSDGWCHGPIRLDVASFRSR